jgi:hypothetical protein
LVSSPFVAGDFAPGLPGETDVEPDEPPHAVRAAAHATPRLRRRRCFIECSFAEAASLRLLTLNGLGWVSLTPFRFPRQDGVLPLGDRDGAAG